MDDLGKLLKRILIEKGNRLELIGLFQKQIWNEENSIEFLSDLAYDLDFYEPDERIRKQESSYYGDEQLENEIKLCLQKILELKQ